MSKAPTIVGHRGAPLLAPENTLASFSRAIALGVRKIELDVHLTSDAQVVVHHYGELGVTDNGKGLIFDKPLAYIQSLDAGSWFSKKFCGERIPLLDEVLVLCKKHQCRLEIEIKDTTTGLVESVFRLVRKYRMERQVEVTTLYAALLPSMLKKAKGILVGGFITPYPHPEWLTKSRGHRMIQEILSLVKLDVVHMPIELVDREIVRRLHTLKKKVAVHSDKASDMRFLKECGVDQISTNNASLAVRILCG